MEELKKELEKLSKAYVDTPENEEKILTLLSRDYWSYQ